MEYLSDIEIAQRCKLQPIYEIAKKAGIDEKYVEPYGRYKAKIDFAAAEGKEKNGKLILVTAITPTPAGEGKTTTTIGLSDGLAKIGKKTARHVPLSGSSPYIFSLPEGSGAAANHHR